MKIGLFAQNFVQWNATTRRIPRDEKRNRKLIRMTSSVDECGTFSSVIREVVITHNGDMSKRRHQNDVRLIACMSRPSVVCNVVALYSKVFNFQQYFCTF